MNWPTFSHWSYLGAAVLPEYIWGRGHWPVLHTETLEGVVPQHLHHTGLWPGHHDHSSRQTNVYKGQSRSIVRNLPYAYTDHCFFLYVRHCSSMTTWIFLYIELQICIYLDLIGNTEIFINLRRLDGPQMTYQICLEISDNEIWYKEKIQIFYSQNLNIFLYLIQKSLSKRGQNSVKMAKTTWQSWNT